VKVSEYDVAKEMKKQHKLISPEERRAFLLNSRREQKRGGTETPFRVLDRISECDSPLPESEESIPIVVAESYFRAEEKKVRVE
jgi:hypothetical protein